MPGRYVFVDGSVVGDIGPAVLKDREILSRDGFVFVVVPVDDYGRVTSRPELISRGFIFIQDAQWLIDGRIQPHTVIQPQKWWKKELKRCGLNIVSTSGTKTFLTEKR